MNFVGTDHPETIVEDTGLDSVSTSSANPIEEDQFDQSSESMPVLEIPRISKNVIHLHKKRLGYLLLGNDVDLNIARSAMNYLRVPDDNKGELPEDLKVYFGLDGTDPAVTGG